MRMDICQETIHEGAHCNLLKIIELVNCRRCQHLPMLGRLPFLEKLRIRNIKSLKRIGAEFYSHGDIVSEAASSSSNSEVKSTVHYFPRLEELLLESLDNLVEWCDPNTSPTVWTGFPTLETLVMESCPALTTTPSKFPSLKQLKVKDIGSGDPLFNILSNKRNLTSLKELHIDLILGLTNLPEELTEYCTSLQNLEIQRCPAMACLPERLSKLVSLETLIVLNCPNLMSLSNLSGLTSLRELLIGVNTGLMCAPEGLQSCKSLEMLNICNCPKIETISDLTGLSHLLYLGINGMTKMIREPPDWLYTLPYLSSLTIGEYRELSEFPDISHLSKITSLAELCLVGWEKLQSLPESLGNFKKLKTLLILNFGELKYLPDWLGNLSSLERLYLADCDKLKKLPSVDAMNRLTKLSYLKIDDCPLLQESIKPNGSEHHKIAAHTEVHI